MRRKFWVVLALTFVVPALLFTASCAKKAVKEESMASQQAENEAAMKAAEKAKQEEMAKQKAIEEENLKKEAMMKQEAMEAFVNQDVHFDFDSSTLTPEAQDILKKKAQWLQDNPDKSITIEGNCDERGTNEYNLALGERRAASAKAFLVDLGISASRITLISYGEERPLDPGHNEAAWAKNRRDHFVINN